MVFSDVTLVLLDRKNSRSTIPLSLSLRSSLEYCKNNVFPPSIRRFSNGDVENAAARNAGNRFMFISCKMETYLSWTLGFIL